MLVIFTKSYPYDLAAEQTFLANELSHLVEKFDRVIVVPKLRSGGRSTPPPGVEIEEGFADFFKKNSRLVQLFKIGFTSSYPYQEICEHPLLLFYPAKILKLLLYSGRAEIVKKWLENFMKTCQIEQECVILYSYWFDDIAMGLGLTKEKFPQVKIVSRAHGYDIYEELYFPYYWPLRRQALTALDRLFPASYDGRDYFCNRYPEFPDLFETAHLGVEDPGFISKSSEDGILRIVSCAHIVPLKRIGLLLEGIAYAARKRPNQKFEWHHFGEGQARGKLLNAVRKRFPRNATGNLPGYVPNQDILLHYKESPVDVFVNLSITEGGAPVSIMEAISCGIPVIVTRVGGNPEIVSDKNGILLNPNPTPEEIAMALLKIWDDPTLAAEMRKESRRVWQTSYNADVNFRNFAERLKSIGES